MTRCLMGIAVLAFMAAYWESGRARTAELESAVPQNDAYTVPEGGVAAITDFIRNLAAIRPATVAADIEYRSHYFPALRKAGERLLDLDKDPKSEAHRAGTLILLADRCSRIAQLESPEQTKAVADLKVYLAQEPAAGAELASRTAKTLQQMGAWDQAADAYKQFVNALGDHGDSETVQTRSAMSAAALRLDWMRKQFPKAAKLAVAPQGKLSPIDIQPQANRGLCESIPGHGRPGNGLAEMPLGQQRFGGATFWIGEKVLQLGSTWVPEGPKTIVVPVQRRASRLYLLHGTFRGYSTAKSDIPMNVKDGTRIGEYRIAYEDGSTIAMPIVYGEDVRDHWTSDGGKPVTRGKVVWTGNNIATHGTNVVVRVYLGVWENPHPEKKLARIEYVSTMDTQCAPYCVAITMEEPAAK